MLTTTTFDEINEWRWAVRKMSSDECEHLAQLRACMTMLDKLPELIDQCSADELADTMVSLLRLRSRSEQIATLVARRAAGAGDVRASDAANTTQWVADCADTAAAPLDVRDAHAIAYVADACQGENAGVVVDALRSGTCTPAVAKIALQESAKVEPIVPEADRDQVLGWFLDLDPASGASGRGILTRQILAKYAPEELDKSDSTLERTESLSWRTTETGMTRLTAELAPVNAAIVKEAVTALSAPQTQRHVDGASTTADERTPGKRRVDALVSLVSAGARLSDTEAAGIGSAARVTVTIPLNTLTAGLGSATTGSGTYSIQEPSDGLRATQTSCPQSSAQTANHWTLGVPNALSPKDFGLRSRCGTAAAASPGVTDHRGSAKSITSCTGQRAGPRAC